MQHDALPAGGEAFGAAAVERFAGVLVVDHQVVMGLGGLLDHLAHRQQGAPTGDGHTGGGLQVLQRGGHDDRGRQPVVLTQLARR